MNPSERVHAEAELERVNRALRMLSGSNHALIHITDEATLLNEVCRIAVEVGGYRMAWVGFRAEDEAKTLRPVGQAGFDAGYLESADLTWADNRARGRGPTGTAIRTGRPHMVRNIFEDPDFAPWREEAARRGYRSTIALPLASEGRTFGALSIYAAEEDAFKAEEVPILTELAGDLAFGLIVLRTRDEHKRTEAALRESEHRFRQVTETIDEIFWLTDAAKEQMIYISPAFSRVWARSRESLYAAPLSWLEAVHPDDRERVKNATLTLQTSGSFNLEYRIVRPDGEVRWIHDRGFPIQDATGKVYRIAGVAADITSRRHLEAQFRQAQKMDAVGRLAGGIAHDFNNILAVIQLQSSLLLEEPGIEPKIDEGVRQIVAATKRAADMTRQLLTFSRQSVRQVRALDLREILGSMTALLRPVLGEDLVLENHFAATLPLVNADPSMMEQVLMNLAVNARDAMPKGGRLTIALSAVDVDLNRASAHGQIAPGRFVCLSVADTGCGISAENLTRVFEPFFTTKEVGKGTGLGLATVFGIVQQHRGWIEVASTVGQGTTFNVYLPAAAASPEQRAAGADAPPVKGGTETILLVEDDEAVRGLTRTTLEHCGYRVIPAATAAAALQSWEAEAARVNLLLTDLIMPGEMKGHELAGELLRRQPRLKVIYTSGYSKEIANGGIRLDHECRFLQKPYSSLDLAATVRSCLDHS